jgi:hypothetical protein
MRRLSDTDVRSLIAFVHDAASVEGPDPFPRPVLQRLEELVPVDNGILYFELDMRTCSTLASVWSRDVDISADALEAVVCYGHEFPLSSGKRRIGAVRLCDARTRRVLPPPKASRDDPAGIAGGVWFAYDARWPLRMTPETPPELARMSDVPSGATREQTRLG